MELIIDVQDIIVDARVAREIALLKAFKEHDTKPLLINYSLEVHTEELINQLLPEEHKHKKKVITRSFQKIYPSLHDHLIKPRKQLLRLLKQLSNKGCKITIISTQEIHEIIPLLSITEFNYYNNIYTYEDHKQKETYKAVNDLLYEDKITKKAIYLTQNKTKVAVKSELFNPKTINKLKQALMK